MLLDSLLHRVALVAVILAAILGLRLISTPTPARADVCSVPVVHTVCTVAGAIVTGVTDGVSWTWNTATNVAGGILGGTKWTLNVGTGFITTAAGGTVIGKVFAGPAGGLACKAVGTVGEGWWGKVCNAAKAIFAKAQGAAKTITSNPSGAAGGGGGAGSGGSGSGAAGPPQDSPQSYLRTSAIAAGAAAAVGAVAHAISRGTTADVEAPWFQSLYGRAAQYAAAVALLALLCALAEGGARGDGQLVMEALRAVPYAAVVTFAASAIIALGVAVVDDLGQLIAGPSLHEATDVLHVLAVLFLALGLAAKGLASHGHPELARIAAFPAAMFSIFGVVGAGLVALELLLREVAIYAGTLFLPLALAARVWPRLGHAAARLGQMLLAVITSKLVLVLTLGLAASAILHGGGTGLLTGAGALLVAGLAPALLYGLFALADHRFHRGALPVAVTPASAGQRMADVVGWHTERANRARAEYYQTRPDLDSPASPSASSGGSAEEPPPPPPAPSSAPSSRPEPPGGDPKEQQDE